MNSFINVLCMCMEYFEISLDNNVVIGLEHPITLEITENSQNDQFVILVWISYRHKTVYFFSDLS